MDEKICDAGASTSDPRTLPLLLTVRQAAELLNVSEKHVTVLCRRGEIKAARVGSTWRIGRDALLTQYGISGTRRDGGESRDSDTVEVVIRIELPADLAERLASARVVVSTGGRAV
jgi:excisionase family DNA binding protein